MTVLAVVTESAANYNPPIADVAHQRVVLKLFMEGGHYYSQEYIQLMAPDGRWSERRVGHPVAVSDKKAQQMMQAKQALY